jgi:hypothetical protein
MHILFGSFLLHSIWLFYHNSNQRKIGSVASSFPATQELGGLSLLVIIIIRTVLHICEW